MVWLYIQSTTFSAEAYLSSLENTSYINHWKWCVYMWYDDFKEGEKFKVELVTFSQSSTQLNASYNQDM